MSEAFFTVSSVVSDRPPAARVRPAGRRDLCQPHARTPADSAWIKKGKPHHARHDSTASRCRARCVQLLAVGFVGVHLAVGNVEQGGQRARRIIGGHKAHTDADLDLFGEFRAQALRDAGAQGVGLRLV